MREQLRTVLARDGRDAMLDYAHQTLAIYRRCARPQSDGRKHFAHVPPFRPHFVTSIVYLRKVLRATPKDKTT